MIQVDKKSKQYLWLIAFAVVVVLTYRPNGDGLSKTTEPPQDVKNAILLPTAHAAGSEVVENTKENKETQENENKEENLDYYKLAYAVAMAETHNCTKGYGQTYNNCMGLKSGNTAPCPVKDGKKQIGRNNMCIYDHWSQSYEAFKIVWKRWYKEFPDRALASKWTGNDRPDTWLKHVRYYYDRAPAQK